MLEFLKLLLPLIIEILKALRDASKEDRQEVLEMLVELNQTARQYQEKLKAGE